MQVVKYNPEKHREMLITWYKSWNMLEDSIDFISDLGLVIEDVCAVFIYLTNSKMVFIESLVSNKEIDNSIREEALILLYQSMHDFMYELAEKHGFKEAITYSSNFKVIERCVNTAGFEFSTQPFYILKRRF